MRLNTFVSENRVTHLYAVCCLVVHTYIHIFMMTSEYIKYTIIIALYIILILLYIPFNLINNSSFAYIKNTVAAAEKFPYKARLFVCVYCDCISYCFMYIVPNAKSNKDFPI